MSIEMQWSVARRSDNELLERQRTDGQFCRAPPYQRGFCFSKELREIRARGNPKNFRANGGSPRPILRRHILDVSRDVPLIAKSVLHASAAITVRLVLRLRNGGRSYCQRAPVERVAIGNV